MCAYCHDRTHRLLGSLLRNTFSFYLFPRPPFTGLCNHHVPIIRLECLHCQFGSMRWDFLSSLEKQGQQLKATSWPTCETYCGECSPAPSRRGLAPAPQMDGRIRSVHSCQHASASVLILLGDLVFLHGLGNKILVVNSLEGVTELLERRWRNYSDRPIFTAVGELMGVDRVRYIHNSTSPLTALSPDCRHYALR